MAVARSPGFHVPAAPDGVFTGEAAYYDTLNHIQGTIVLDNGTLYSLGAADYAVDHNRRLLMQIARQGTALDLTTLKPPALYLGHTAVIRAERDRDQPWDSSTFYGQERNVRERVYGNNTFEFYEDELHFDGSRSKRSVSQLEQPVEGWDFDWQLMEGPKGQQISYQGIPDGEGNNYRVLSVGRYGMTRGKREAVYYQQHVTGYWLPGRWEVGFYRPEKNVIDNSSNEPYQYEVTDVLEYEYAVLFDEDGNPYTSDQVTRTRVSAWVRFGQRLRADPNYVVPQPVVDKQPEYIGTQQVGWMTRSVGEGVKTLRDFKATEAPPFPKPPGPRFTAAGGRVTVRGPRTVQQADLTDSILGAWGHTFRGGTWAALRGRPIWREDTKDWDYSPVIVLHASDTTITAVRSDGSSQTCTRADFERHVLRAEAGSFLGFDSVGSLSHSWPPEWAWCVCGGDTRAVVAHEAWRDSVKKAINKADPPEWEWKARPRRRPKTLPASAPHELLGLTLADVTDGVQRDEALPRGEGPVRPPISAVQQVGDRRLDVLKKVAKRLPYSPAHIPDEQDDTTFVSGAVSVTFGPLPPLSAQQVEPPYGCALYLRYKGRAESVRVNGEDIPLIKLGHNAAEKTGWHPYVLVVPALTHYNLTFKGQVSLVGQVVRALGA